MKRGVVLLVLLLLVSIVNADYSLKIVENKIKYTEEATFVVYITNPGLVDRVYTVSLDSDKFELFANKDILIRAGETDTLDVTLKPVGEVDLGKNRVNLFLRSDKEEIVPLDVDVDLSDMIDVNIGINKEIDPKKEVTFKLRLKNNAKVNLKDVTIKVNCEVCKESSLLVDLDGESELTKQGVLKVDENTKPGLYILDVDVWKGNLLSSKSVDLYVIISPDVRKIEEVESKFLVSIVKFGRENKGNFENEGSINLEITGLRRYFTKFYPGPDKIEGNIYLWNYKIPVNDRYIITAVTDYRVIVLVLLLLVLVVLLIVYYKTRKIIVLKNVEGMKGEGTAKGLKVFLVIKNKDRVMRDVRVFDYVPALISLSNKYGTINPSKIEKSEKFIRLRWDIAKLDMWEERILSYEVKSRLHIFGKLLLPSCVVLFKNGRGRTRRVKSNFLNIIFSK